MVTFKNAKKLKEVVENIPLTSIVLETTARTWHEQTVESVIILLISVGVAEKIAELKGITYEEVVEQTEKKCQRYVPLVVDKKR